MYSPGVTGQNYLRGVQEAGADRGVAQIPTVSGDPASGITALLSVAV